RHRRGPGKALEEVQRYSFALEQASRRAVGDGQRSVAGEAVAFLEAWFEANGRVERGKYGLGHDQASDDARLLNEESCFRADVGSDCRKGGHVIAGAIFRKRRLDRRINGSRRR